MGAEGDLAEERLQRGCSCFVIKVDQEIGAYGWLSTAPEWIGELELVIKPREREGYIWNCVTRPEHRRKGMFGSLVAGITLAARRLGSKRLWIGSVAIPAEKALAPLGFRPALYFDCRTFAGLHLMRVSRGADRALAADASSVLGVRPGLLIRGSRRLRH